MSRRKERAGRIVQAQQPLHVSPELGVLAAFLIEKLRPCPGRKRRGALEDALEPVERSSMFHQGSVLLRKSES
jgi:hypothetical protein